MKKALIIVDYNNDFVAEDGKITCGKPAQEIDDTIAKIVEEFSLNGDFIFNTCDNHTENDTYNKETKMFPAHCISGTSGRELYGNTFKAVSKVKKEQLVEIEKIMLSAFAGTSLDLKLRERDIKDVYLVGVCSDICVLHTAIEAYGLGYNIYIYEKGIASFNEEGHKFALNHFKNTLGATII